MQLDPEYRTRVLETAAEAAHEWDREHASTREWIPRWKQLNHVERARVTAFVAVAVDAALELMPEPETDPESAALQDFAGEFNELAGGSR